ncbi:MraY family glycosyltransferase [Flavisolibacter tropicus]|uniref:Glycosyl transferase n=1 Tax=Flavisolibacter tropicus TaxID=1492898 RepID=A0A172U013_9BACT|nr:MraY family glycosyltransferase [Flavisolibacter tropicus]ANE52572.1 glycosyl transferase [Flavisolibacter tropicus]
MLHVLLTASVAFIITFFAIPAIITVAEQKKLFDIPDARKLHTRPIASLGGIGIFSGFFLASLLGISVKAYPEFQFFFAAATMIFFIGINDDMIVMSPMRKFIGQVVAAAVLIHLGEIRITSMHGLFGLEQLPDAVSLAFSYMTIIVIINAFNLIDGIDGLAGTLGMLTTSVFGTYFLMANMPAYAVLSFSMTGSLLAFLIFNYNPAKIFMGDTGSLLLGLVNAILAIKFISVADSTNVLLPMESAVAIGFSILMVPLSDTLRVFSIRILRGRSPFTPDRHHIHHLLLDRGLNHKYITLCCLLVNVFFIALAYFSRGLGPTYTLLLLCTVATVMLAALLLLKKPVAETAASAKPKSNALAVHTKVVPITKETAIAENE